MQANYPKRTAKKAVPDAPKQSRVRLGALKTPIDCRKYLARCIRRAEKAGGDVATVNRYYKLSMMGVMLLRATEAADLEARVIVIENTLAQTKQRAT
jgi:hypothetical protein